jgi:hypothetical protein
MSRHVRASAVVGALLISALAGCRRESITDPRVAAFVSEPFFIRGAITQVGAPGGFLVEGEPGTSYRIDKAYFRVSAETQFLRSDGSAASAADLKVGRNITLWITGIIRESYPVQVDALRILVE